MPDRTRWWLLRVTVIAGLLAGIALSPRLWLSSRLYPLTPVISVLQPFPAPLDRIVLALLAVALTAAMLFPRRVIFVIALALMLLFAAQDQSRLQPWFYEYLILLFTMTFAGKSAMRTCSLIVACIYFWSGISKLNSHFTGEVFPWLLTPILGERLAHAPLILYLAIGAAVLECAMGIALFVPRLRTAAIACIVGMHALILISVGPFGHSHNTVIWPWNIVMIAILFILFYRRADKLWPANWIVLLLIGVMPAFSYVNLWDHYLAISLYSGNPNWGTIYVSDEAFDRLPQQIQNYATEAGPNRNQIDIDEWSFGELNVPPYPEPRIYQSVLRKVCSYTAGKGVQLEVTSKRSLQGGETRTLYPCPQERKGR